MPVELACLADRNATLRGLGIDTTEISKETEHDVVRALSVFYRNFRPVFRGLLAAQSSGSTAFGKPVVIHHTGVGNVSSSHLQMDSEGLEAINDLAVDIVNCALQGKPPPYDSHAFGLLSSVAGPVFAVRNLVAKLVDDLKDGTTDLFNPKNSSPAGTFNEVYEMAKILKLLKQLD
jgi:hypothetical protein